MRIGYKVTIALGIVAVLAGNLMAQKGGGGGGEHALSRNGGVPLSAHCRLHGARRNRRGHARALRGTTQGGSPTTREGTSSNNGFYLTEGNLFLFVLKPGLGRFASFDFSRQLGTAPCAGSGVPAARTSLT